MGVMRNIQGRIHTLAAVLGLLVRGLLADTPMPLNSTLVIGREWTAVRSVYRVPLLIGPQKVELGGIPAEADLSSLLVRDQRINLNVNPADRKAYAQTVNTPPLSDSAVWCRTAPINPCRTGGDVTVLLDSPLGGVRNLEVIYLTRGLSWSVNYQLRTRGDLRSAEEERFSVDLAGFAEIVNDTGKSFDSARLFLTGSESPVIQKTVHDPGFLALSDSPLADLWKETPAPEMPESLYAIEGTHTLPCNERISIPLLDALRIPAEREYVMSSEEVPLAAKGSGTPLREVICFTNTKDHGIGRPLPEGSVLIFRTGALRYRMTTARMSPAGVHDMIRIDLGTDDGVMGYRSRLERTVGAAKTVRERYGIRLVSTKDGPLQILLRETPHPVLEWTVIRCGESYVKKGRTLEMRTILDARSEKMIEYTLQIKQPVW